mgnify:CR=1 FL=1
MDFSEGCSICGEDLVYAQEHTLKQCTYCGAIADSNIQCPMGHFVCDACHSSSAVELIEKYCQQSLSIDPMKSAVMLMKSPVVKMHGPEHHFLVPAVLLTAYYNSLNEPETKIQKLSVARKRAESVHGGYCGTHGACGAAIGVGIFISIITGTTPLKEQEWSLSNAITGEALIEISKQGGPRCCKRDSFIVIKKAVEFLKTNLDFELPLTNVVCEFHKRNKQCRFDDCIYFPS